MTPKDLAAQLSTLVVYVLGVLGITVDDGLSTTIKSTIVGALAAITIAHRVVAYLDKRHKRNAAVSMAAAVKLPTSIETLRANVISDLGGLASEVEAIRADVRAIVHHTHTPTAAGAPTVPPPATPVTGAPTTSERVAL